MLCCGAASPSRPQSAYIGVIKRGESARTSEEVATGTLVIDRPLPAAAIAGRKAARPGAWKRFIDAIVESRRIAVERQLNAYFDRHPELERPAGLERRPAWKQAADALPF